MQMKTYTAWLMSALLVAQAPMTWAQKAPVKMCFVATFKSIALRTDPPELRANLARAWLENNAASCTDAQLSTLLANSPNWLGTALTLEISAILEGAIEAKIAGNPELMSKLYESLGKEGQASTVTYTNPTPRAPVVSPMVNTGIISGSANYGVIRGDTNINQNNNQVSNANSNQNASPEAQSSQKQINAQGQTKRN